MYGKLPVVKFTTILSHLYSNKKDINAPALATSNKDNLYSKGKELYDSLPKQDKEFLGGHYIDSKNISFRLLSNFFISEFIFLLIKHSTNLFYRKHLRPKNFATNNEFYFS